jgi:hypothetical protein
MAGDPERVHENDSEDELEQELAARDPGKYEDPLRGGLHSTNLVVEKYCKKWQPRHAFREFYQNWYVHSSLVLNK